MSTVPLVARVESLEATAYRTTEDVAHLAGRTDELSTDLRSIAQDVAELRRETAAGFEETNRKLDQILTLLTGKAEA